ncbi:MAG: hypothetical protein HYV04_08165, partial [Deltaproteobacteria bacterium]|nr:hypothetical protein [Deltaproteobacteria bacterium]
ARQYFSDITAYTYGYRDGGEPWSEDVSYAERLADFLGIGLRLVPASAHDVDEAVEPALCYGQDWRDFNVHCAVVNEILAGAMKRDLAESPNGPPPLVMTGDLMNEFLADYTPISYRGREYYTLPKLEPDRLRLTLIRGLDAGDREIGIFNRHGLDILQPYGCLLDPYLNVPSALTGQPEAKQLLVREIAGDLLPAFALERPKVRAQIGSSKETTGILPLFVRSGRDATWLKKAFCDFFMVSDPRLLNQFIRAGVYRFASEFPKEVKTDHGYFTR